MGLLALRIATSVAVTGSACYSPELRDCTLACLETSDCADGQVCGADRFCASPEIAGQCGTRPPRDAGPTDPDADESVPTDGAADAPPTPPDAPSYGVVEVKIDGKGHVVVIDHGTCDSDAPQNGECEFMVPLDAQITVEANADWFWMFDEWTTSTCPDENNRSCTFWPAASVEVRAKFRKFDGDDDD